MRVGLTEQIAEVRRELELRKRVYPGLIARGKLDEIDARKQYKALEAVLKTLETLEQEVLI